MRYGFPCRLSNNVQMKWFADYKIIKTPSHTQALNILVHIIYNF